MPTPRRSLRYAVVATVVVLTLSGCATAMKSTATAPLTAEQLAQLWVEPVEIQSRNLFDGPGGAKNAPDKAAVYQVTGLDVAGYSHGYDVEDAQGRKWRIKLGDESQPEVVASRLLWAIGFHQPPTYFLQGWKLDGGRPEDEGRAARFRLESGYEVDGEWSWHQNPFVGTRQFKGLLVAQLILNNWDLKTPQNRVYRVSDAERGPPVRYVVQDLGAALGKSRWPTGTKNNVSDFESQNLIDGMKPDGRIDFDYHARHTELFEDITLADVVWTCRLFSQLTDAQWEDAFRAAAYPEAFSKRFIAKLKSKVQEGLALDRRAATP